MNSHEKKPEQNQNPSEVATAYILDLIECMQKCNQVLEKILVATLALQKPNKP